MCTQSTKKIIRRIASSASLGFLLTTHAYSSAAQFEALRKNGVSMDPGKILEYKLSLFTNAAAINDSSDTTNSSTLTTAVQDVRTRLGYSGSSQSLLTSVKALIALINGAADMDTADLLTQISVVQAALQSPVFGAADIQVIGAIQALFGSTLTPTALSDIYSQLSTALEALDGADGTTGTLEARLTALATAIDGTMSVPGTSVGTGSSNFLVQSYTGLTSGTLSSNPFSYSEGSLSVSIGGVMYTLTDTANNIASALNNSSITLLNGSNQFTLSYFGTPLTYSTYLGALNSSYANQPINSSLNAKLQILAAALGSTTGSLTTQLTDIATALDATTTLPGMLSDTTGSGFSFTRYSGTTNQTFSTSSAVGAAAAVTLIIGGEVYTYRATANSNPSPLTFLGANGHTFVLNAAGTYNDASASTNAANIRIDLNTYLTGSSISSNLSAKIANSAGIQETISVADAKLLTIPTGVLITDIATVQGLLVTTPGATIQADINTVNTSLGGSGNTQARVTSADAKLLTTPTGVLITDIGTTQGLLVATPGATLQADINTVNTSLGSSGTIQARINAINTGLGGSGNTLNRANAINALLDGVQSLSGLTSFTVTTTASNSSGTINIVGNDGSAGRSYGVNTAVNGINIGDETGGTTQIANGATVALTHSDSGNTITFVNNSGGSITSAASLATYLANAYPVSSVIKNTITSKATALKTLLGGSGYSSMSNAATLAANIGGSGSGLAAKVADVVTSVGGTGADLAAKVTTQIQAIESSATVLNTAISDVDALLGGSSADIYGKISTMNTYLGSSGTMQARIDDLSTILVSNTNYSSPLYTQFTTQSTNLDNGLSSLPSFSTYAVIGTAAASDSAGGVNIIINSGLGLANGTYNLSAATITGSVTNGSTFTLTNGSNNLVLYNRSGSTINTQAQAIRYLASMYPATSQIATGISDKIANGLNKMIGGTATSVRARIAAVDASLLINPTGVLATDRATLASKIVTTPSGVLETDVQTINGSLDGTASGSTVQARIGAPTINGSASNLATVIGGTGDLATRLGDPVTGTTGLASLIRNNHVSIGNNDHGLDCSTFDNATTLNEQLSAFLAILNAGGVDKLIPNGTYSSFAEALDAMRQNA